MAKITVYSTAMCPFCIGLKKYLEEKHIEFEDFDVAEDENAREEMIEKSGQMGVPVIEINEKIIVGFDKEKLEAELKASNE
ncbi:MAG: glutaredoxin family protein [Candidatus Woesearchaeota archaeon]|nr:MAG: glutaredoxin family protein [Candidatus Woesearchaeota archaeon]